MGKRTIFSKTAWLLNLLLVFGTAVPVWAQWSNSVNDVTYTNDKVLIGETSDQNSAPLKLVVANGYILVRGPDNFVSSPAGIYLGSTDYSLKAYPGLGVALGVPGNSYGIAVNSSGCGMGTVTPLSQLHVKTSSLPSSSDFYKNNVATFDYGSSMGLAVVALPADQDDKMGFKVSAGKSLVFGIESVSNDVRFIERMRIDKNGNVGIGTSASPTQKLSVNGNVFIKTDLGDGITISGNNTISATSNSNSNLTLQAVDGVSLQSLSGTSLLVNGNGAVVISNSVPTTSDFFNNVMTSFQFQNKMGLGVIALPDPNNVDNKMGIKVTAGNSLVFGIQSTNSNTNYFMEKVCIDKNGTHFNSTDGNGIYITKASDGATNEIKSSGKITLSAENGNTSLLLGGGSISTLNPITIGSDAKPTPLTVHGNVSANQVLASEVVINNKWTLKAPDYVFEKDYKFPKLKDVEKQIQSKKHLPDVPSAQEMNKNGVNLAQMNMALLKKVEELTLYVIEQNKRIEALERDRKR